MTGTIPDVRVASEPHPYARGLGTARFFLDVVAEGAGDRSARARLERGADATRRDLELRASRPGADGERALRQLAQYDLTTADGQGGHFLPPTHVIDAFVGADRPGRPLASAMTWAGNTPPADKILVPKVGTGASVAVHADNAAVSETDPSDTVITADVREVAGQIDMSAYAYERGAGSIDLVSEREGAADYGSKLDAQCINGTGAAPQALGVLQVGSIGSVAYNDASPTLPELHPKGAAAMRVVSANLKLPLQAWFMHSRRWEWMLAQVDTTGRALAKAEVPITALGLLERVGSDHVVGQWHGRPVVTDDNIPTNLGAGTNEDVILGLRLSDLWLWEDEAPRIRVMRDFGGTNQARIQLVNYVATMPQRRPKAIVTIAGTGLVDPNLS